MRRVLELTRRDEDRRRLGGWGGAVPAPARERRDAARPAGEDAGGPLSVLAKLVQRSAVVLDG